MSDVIALIFDFDDTLASDSTSGFLDSIGVDTASFWKEDVDPLLSQQDWDPVPAYLYQMIRLSQSGRYGPITQQRLKDWGARLELHDGVPTLFQRLRAAVRAEQPQVQLEFYLISSGIGDVVRSTPIAHEFTEIWASEFVYGEDGGIMFPRRIVSFTDKTRYLFHIQKGIIGRDFRNKPFEVNRKVPEDRLRVVAVLRVDDDHQRAVEAGAEALGHDVGGLALGGIGIRRSIGRQGKLHLEYRRSHSPQGEHDQRHSQAGHLLD